MSSENVDLIWKDYEGVAVGVRQEIKPGVCHGEGTFLTHPFIVRSSSTGRLMTIQNEDNSKSAKIFEGLEFGANHRGKICVNITT